MPDITDVDVETPMDVCKSSRVPVKLEKIHPRLRPKRSATVTSDNYIRASCNGMEDEGRSRNEW